VETESKFNRGSFLTLRAACRARTSRAGRSRTTGAVPVPFRTKLIDWTDGGLDGLDPFNTVQNTAVNSIGWFGQVSFLTVPHNFAQSSPSCDSFQEDIVAAVPTSSPPPHHHPTTALTTLLLPSPSFSTSLHWPWTPQHRHPHPRHLNASTLTPSPLPQMRDTLTLAPSPSLSPSLSSGLTSSSNLRGPFTPTLAQNVGLWGIFDSLARDEPLHSAAITTNNVRKQTSTATPLCPSLAPPSMQG